MKKMLIMALALTAVSFAQNSSDLKNFYIELGKKEALKEIEKIKEKAYLEGYKQGLEDAKKYLLNYASKIIAYEVGKYMVKHKLLTYPQIYGIIDTNSGELKFVIIKPHVSDIKNVSSIFEQGKLVPIYLEKIENGKVKIYLSNTTKNLLEAK